VSAPKNTVEQWDDAVALHAAAREFSKKTLELAAQAIRDGSSGVIPVTILARVTRVAGESEPTFGVSVVPVSVAVLSEAGLPVDTMTMPQLSEAILNASREVEDHAVEEKEPFNFRLNITLLPTLPSLKRGGKPDRPGLLAVEQFLKYPIRMYEAFCEASADGVVTVEPWVEISRADVSLMENEFEAAQKTHWNPAKTVAASKSALN
jgi:hypothetical protein